MPPVGPPTAPPSAMLPSRSIGRYNPDAVVCVGVPFGHTRPQWILPYGGDVTVDGVRSPGVGRLQLTVAPRL